MESLKIDSKAEENFLFSLIDNEASIPIGQYFFGGLLVGDYWKWNSDASEIYFGMKWYPGQPSNKHAEKCMTILKDDKQMGVNDAACEARAFGFLCQKTKNPKMSLDLERQFESDKAEKIVLQQQLENEKAAKLNLESQLGIEKDEKLVQQQQFDSQMGVCKLLSQALNTMLITGNDISLDATDSHNARKHKTVTVSVTSNEYEY